MYTGSEAALPSTVSSVQSCHLVALQMYQTCAKVYQKWKGMYFMENKGVRTEVSLMSPEL